jgi:hypothetical protein
MEAGNETKGINKIKYCKNWALHRPTMTIYHVERNIIHSIPTPNVLNWMFTDRSCQPQCCRLCDYLELLLGKISNVLYFCWYWKGLGFPRLLNCSGCYCQPDLIEFIATRYSFFLSLLMTPITSSQQTVEWLSCYFFFNSVCKKER